MNSLQRLIRNIFLSLTGNIVVKAGNSLLFISISRVLGSHDSGIFSLGITYYTFVFGLSALGLHELIVREVAPRRDQSGRFFVNFIFLRLLTSAAFYGLLIAGLFLFTPYSAETTRVILILSLAAIPEAVFSMCQALFEAHERLSIPMTAAIGNTAIKLGAGFWLLSQGAPVTQIAWVVPIASTLSLLLFVPGLISLFRNTPQSYPARINTLFLRSQAGFMSSFFVIHLSSLLDYQTDALLISLFLTEEDLGYYTAAQTILLAFNLIPLAIRTALYPLMSRYHSQEPDKLTFLYERVGRYLAALSLPMAAGVTLLAEPIITLVFGPDFAPAIPVLQISIWAIVFLFLNVPHSRLMLVRNRQRAASWMTGIAMAANILLNILLIPRLGINGAAIARLISAMAIFLSFYIYSHLYLIRSSLWSVVARPLLATGIMALAIAPLRNMNLLIPIAVGILTYAIASLVVGVIPNQDIAHWRQIYQVRNQSTKE